MQCHMLGVSPGLVWAWAQTRTGTVRDPGNGRGLGMGWVQVLLTVPVSQSYILKRNNPWLCTALSAWTDQVSAPLPPCREVRSRAGAVTGRGWAGGAGLAQGHGVGLFAFGGAHKLLATAHSDPLWVQTCVNGGGGGVPAWPRLLVVDRCRAAVHLWVSYPQVIFALRSL